MRNIKRKPCIGYLSPSDNVTPLKKACANYARAFDFDFILFTPEDLSSNRKQIKATKFVDSKVTKATVPFPDVIIDRFRGKGSNTKYQEFYQEITTHSLLNNSQDKQKLNKILFYQCLEENNLLTDMQIPTLKSNQHEDIIQFIDREKKVILKPTSSLRGRGVYYIEKKKESYGLLSGVFYEEVSDEEIEVILKEILTEEYVAQRYIQSEDKEQRPFDIRVHVMKDYQGQWVVAAYYVRIGIKEGITSNFSEDGYTDRVESFFKKNVTLFEDKSVTAFIQRLIQTSLEIVNQLNDFLPKGLSHLGLDLAFNFEEQKFYLFEVNTYLPEATYFEHNIAEHLVGYAVHLYENSKSQEVELLDDYPVENVMAAEVDNISTYLIMLAAWRKGLEIQAFYKKEAFQYAISDGKDKYIFKQAESNLIPLEARKMINTSHILEKTLKKNDLKLITLSKNRSVKDTQKFKLLILNKRIASLLEIKDLVLKGDGVHTIEQLIKRKSDYYNFVFHTQQNDERLRISKVLKEDGYQLTSRLKEEEEMIIPNARFELKDLFTVEKDELYTQLKETAQKVINTIPQLIYAEVELIVTRTKEIIISDINTNPKLELFLYPDKGKVVDIIKDLLKLHFKEIDDDETEAKYITFNLKEIQQLSKDAAIHAVLLDPFMFDQKNQLFIVQSSKLSTRGKRNFRAIFLENELHGHLRESRDYFEIHCNGKGVLKVKRYLEKYFKNVPKVHKISEEPIVLGYREYDSSSI